MNFALRKASGLPLVISSGFKVLQFPSIRSVSNSTLPKPPKLPKSLGLENMSSARDWIEKFRSSSIPREAVQLSFARSSGPGGQNVNKVNTKCAVRCPLSATWVPHWAKAHLRKSTKYVSSSDALLITSTATRSQAQNVDDCLSKLHKLILEASTIDLKNEPTEAQKRQVRELQKVQKVRRREEKEYRSQTKRSRSKKDFWD